MEKRTGLPSDDETSDQVAGNPERAPASAGVSPIGLCGSAAGYSPVFSPASAR
jgi:hypothetical protein